MLSRAFSPLHKLSASELWQWSMGKTCMQTARSLPAPGEMSLPRPIRAILLLEAQNYLSRRMSDQPSPVLLCFSPLASFQFFDHSQM